MLSGLATVTFNPVAHRDSFSLFYVMLSKRDTAAAMLGQPPISSCSCVPLQARRGARSHQKGPVLQLPQSPLQSCPQQMAHKPHARISGPDSSETSSPEVCREQSQHLFFIIIIPFSFQCCIRQVPSQRSPATQMPSAGGSKEQAGFNPDSPCSITLR